MFDQHDSLLYVGITIDLGTRITSHRALQPWWHEVRTIRLETFDTREDAEEAERTAIRNEDPLHNFNHSRLNSALPMSGGASRRKARVRLDLATTELHRAIARAVR